MSNQSTSNTINPRYDEIHAEHQAHLLQYVPEPHRSSLVRLNANKVLQAVNSKRSSVTLLLDKALWELEELNKQVDAANTTIELTAIMKRVKEIEEECKRINDSSK